MANLLKPSADQIVFGNSQTAQTAQPARRRPAQNHNVSFLAQDDAGESVVKKVAGVLRVVATAAVLVSAFAISGLI